jgi:hypothetical protein
MDYEAEDKAILEKILLADRYCPRCRVKLRPVALLENVWGCPNHKETWYLPNKEGEQ